MKAMNIQDRYNEIVALSGCSEQVVRRVMKAAQQSLVNSLKTGKSATLPGVCTLYPELRNKIDYQNGKTVNYIKIKAKASLALQTEFSKVEQFSKDTNDGNDIEVKQLDLGNGTESTQAVVITPVEDRYKRTLEVRTEQLGSLL